MNIRETRRGIINCTREGEIIVVHAHQPESPYTPEELNRFKQAVALVADGPENLVPQGSDGTKYSFTAGNLTAADMDWVSTVISALANNDIIDGLFAPLPRSTDV